MPHVHFTNHLRAFFPNLEDIELDATKVCELVEKIDDLHPGLGDYIVDEHGALRKHVNIFVAGEGVKDRARLSDTLASDVDVHILQALSGG